jgi:Dolichyl-phosphate-mannose-protein mannosyltransferase
MKWTARKAFGLAFGVRVVILATLVFRAPFNEAGPGEAVVAAGNLVTRHQFIFYHGAGPGAWLAPVYPLLLALIFAVGGIETHASVLIAQLLNIVFASVAAAVIYKAAFRIAGAFAAAFTSIAWAICPWSVLPCVLVSDTCLSVMVLSLALYSSMKLEESDSTLDWILCGLSWGTQAMVSPAMLAAFPCILLRWLWVRRNPRHVLLLGAAAMLVVAPWLLRNWLTLGSPFILRSDGWAELYYGNAGYAEHPLHDSGEYQRLGDAKYSALMRRKAVALILGHPRMVMTNALRRFWQFWTLPTGYAGLPGLISALALCGSCWLLLEWDWKLLPFYSALFCCPVIYYFSLSYSRYRNPLEPVMFLMIGCSVPRLLRHAAATPPRLAPGNSSC